jgi:hypothetical protein
VTGRPSCTLTGAGATKSYVATSSVPVSDNAWHTLECRRSGSVLSVLVDGAVRGRTDKLPAGLTVSNTAPLSIGGKSVADGNDQYQGLLDDVWVAVG